ncbi:ead/Ea22-like family protein [Salmonella enterica subsp. enterica serovar Montevideo]|uniref:Ead/Ea22-like family protein n=1 Tax=Salmonella montevideo TaxID=115981 RepID=A0A725HJY9_SALMO|nr:ead/Ea22-like family protein [Salmonella enterica subsp. enterica serovar Montevideo]EBO9850916.1 ead/Ea22-like family protein [Salmonella enterica]HCZ3100470.1 ead/Ea22-like family protein [Salmonella enterica subsp. enterica serovar Anatum str. CFSAN004012]EBL5254504.1 ead/Ea22-like family protein [Salmonella enterica subsp. enterica serovar Montevideo]EBL5763369.1 ead/Ea22-like family protein [Salmonella enterica subsp. enterica serovar Montevideo]
MSNIDKQALREAATVATQGGWYVDYDFDVCHESGAFLAETHGDNLVQNAKFIAAANPATVLALLDELEKAQRANVAQDDHINQQQDRIEKLEKGHQEAAKQINSWRRLAKQNIAERGKDISELEAARQRIAELEAREIKPAKGEVLVVVSGFTGCGKSAIAGEIEIAMKAIGVPVQWTNGDAEKHMTGADWLTAIEMYKPTVRIVEVNVPRAAGIKVKES